MTLKVSKAVEIWKAYQAGAIDAETALFQCVFMAAKPSQRKVYQVIATHPGITSMQIATLFEWSDGMAGTTLKNLLDMGLVTRRECWSEDGRNTQYFRYYAVQN